MANPKGQLISKGFFGILNYSKKYGFGRADVLGLSHSCW